MEREVMTIIEVCDVVMQNPDYQRDMFSQFSALQGNKMLVQGGKACEVACALADKYDVTLLYATNKMGVLLDSDDDDSFITSLTEEHFKQLVDDNAILGDTMTMLQNAFKAKHQGVKNVIVCSAICLDGKEGTRIEN